MLQQLPCPQLRIQKICRTDPEPVLIEKPIHLVIDAQTVRDITGCSKEEAVRILNDKTSVSKIRGAALLRADDKIYEIYLEMKGDQ